MSSEKHIDQKDVQNLTEKLSDWAASALNEKEKSLLAGVFELAGKMYEGTHPPSSEKRKLSLTRETVRELHVWERLIETQGYSLWTCDRPNPFDQVILPLKK